MSLMLHSDSVTKFGALALLFLAFISLSQRVAEAATIIHSDNVSKTTAGTESASGARRLTSSFGTGTEATYLTSITLPLANPINGQATLSVYTNNLLKPGTLVGTLVSPTSYASTTAETTFTAATSIPLAANTTYSGSCCKQGAALSTGLGLRTTQAAGAVTSIPGA